MKKNIFLFVSLLSINAAIAQTSKDFIFQPTHIIGKRINSLGEVTKTLESDFSYAESGKVYSYVFPEFAISTTFTYEGDFLTQERTRHTGGYPLFYETLSYTYENGKVKTISHCWDQMNSNEYWQYDYNENGRLRQKDYKEGEGDFHQHYLYEYSNNGTTKIESFWTSWLNEGMLLKKRTTYQYDEEYRLLTVLIENYNANGEMTSNTRTTYSYTQTGKEESETTQTLIDGEWVNSTIQRYIYNDFDWIIEQQNGSWQQNDNEWNITRKINFELSEDGQTCFISFYKKSDEEWVWDMFNNQDILLNPLLKIQQRTLRFYVYEEMSGAGRINQFEISLEQTTEPVYLDTEEKGQGKCAVFPNPGNEKVNVLAPIEDAVIRFYSMQGKMIHARPFDFQVEVDTQSWPVGIYFWEIYQKNQRIATGKWIKE